MIKNAADQGFADAQHRYAGCLKDGVGVKTDLEGYVLYLRMAADQGYVDALREYGVALMNGYGVNGNETEGMRYLLMAAEKGDFESHYQLGVWMIKRNDVVSGCKHVRIAAHGGFVSAIEVLASDCLKNGGEL
jgi:TPR repeat protein